MVLLVVLLVNRLVQRRESAVAFVLLVVGSRGCRTKSEVFRVHQYSAANNANEELDYLFVVIE